MSMPIPLTKLLDSKFKAGFTYSAMLKTGKIGSVSIAGDNFIRFIEDYNNTKKFYEDQGQETKLFHIRLLCNTCLGSCVVQDGFHLRSPYKGKSKYKKCPDCKGLGKVELE